MVHVVGNWELSWNTPIKEAELWQFPLREFRIPSWWMWPVTGIRCGEQALDLQERETLAEILEELEGTPRVFFEPKSVQHRREPEDLRDFRHPEDVVYIFGSVPFCPVPYAREEDAVVLLPTLDNKGTLWPHQVLVTLLYDRMVKGWR